jgi:hypothetical protein
MDRRSTPRTNAAKRFNRSVEKLFPGLSLDAPISPDDRNLASAALAFTGDSAYGEADFLKLERLVQAIERRNNSK